MKVGAVNKKKDLHAVYDKPHKNLKKIAEDTRMPIKKGMSTAFPTAKKHFLYAENWDSEFGIMESRANHQRFKTQREFFDRPVARPYPIENSDKKSVSKMS